MVGGIDVNKARRLADDRGGREASADTMEGVLAAYEFEDAALLAVLG